MLGIRHRCGQVLQFWIPAYLVAPLIEDLSGLEVGGLAEWMSDEGMLPPDGAPQPDDLLEHLRNELEPRNVALIDVEKDVAACPACGGLIPWVEAVSQYVASQNEPGY